MTANRLHPPHIAPVHVLLLIAGCFLSLAASPATASGEFWPEFQFSHALSPGLALKADLTARYHDDSTEPYYRYGEVGFAWELSSHVKAVAKYSHVLTSSGERNSTERRPALDLTLGYNALHMRLSDRNLLEWRFQNSDLSYRYRNKLTVSGPGLMDTGVRPYAFGELFCDLSKSEVNKQRAGTGLEIPLGGAMSLDMYYLAEFRLSDDTWSRVDVTGVRVTCKS